ncbi:GntR family transcriptional regulator, partial [Faecalibaculum rodentium]
MELEIILKPGGDTPIYEQIEEQIRAGVISGTLAANTPIPSIRALAKALRVSVIT